MSTVDATGQRSVAAGPLTLWIGGGQPVATAAGPAPTGVEGRLTIRGSLDIAPF